MISTLTSINLIYQMNIDQTYYMFDIQKVPCLKFSSSIFMYHRLCDRKKEEPSTHDGMLSVSTILHVFLYFTLVDRIVPSAYTNTSSRLLYIFSRCIFNHVEGNASIFTVRVWINVAVLYVRRSLTEMFKTWD